MNSFLQKMYATRKAVEQQKNPNRVLGGLKGAGVNSFSMLGEDGVEKQIPIHADVMALEEKLRTLEARINEQEKQIRRSRQQ